MIIENYLYKIFIESYIFSDDTIAVDFDDFKNGQKPLLIIGLSGSGKSSISKEISEKYNTNRINLDNKDIPNKKDLSKEEIISLVNEMDKSIILKSKNDVIDGASLTLIKNFPHIYTYPCIIMGKSYLKSSWDATIRNYKNKTSSNSNAFLKHLFYRFYQNFTLFYKPVEEFRKERLKNTKTIQDIKEVL